MSWCYDHEFLSVLSSSSVRLPFCKILLENPNVTSYLLMTIKVSALSPPLVVGRSRCPSRPTTAPTSASPLSLYRRIKRRLGHSLRGLHCPRSMVHPRNPIAHKFLELKAVLLAAKQFEHLCQDKIVLNASDTTTVISYINKERGMSL